MTQQQKRWASQHDWFIRETITGVICRGENVGEEISFNNFKKLKNWAGY